MKLFDIFIANRLKEARMEGAREAITQLAMHCDGEAKKYKQKCKENRAEYYDDIARFLRNYREWAIVIVSKK